MTGDVRLESVTPIFRIFDIDKARAFYIGFLGFEVLWEHRFGDGFPLYFAVGRDGCELHLSEHHGDATPGSAIRIRVNGLAALHASVTATNYPFMRPGIETPPWGGREMSVIDPFANRITFFEPD